MESTDWNMVMGLGGFFVFIGILLLLSGKREEQGYYDALANRNDVHEFVSHDPERAEPGALKVGGAGSGYSGTDNGRRFRYLGLAPFFFLLYIAGFSRINHIRCYHTA